MSVWLSRKLSCPLTTSFLLDIEIVLSLLIRQQTLIVLRLKLEEGKDQYEMDLNGMKVVPSETMISFSKGLWQNRDVSMFITVEVF